MVITNPITPGAIDMLRHAADLYNTAMGKWILRVWPHTPLQPRTPSQRNAWKKLDVMHKLALHSNPLFKRWWLRETPQFGRSVEDMRRKIVLWLLYRGWECQWPIPDRIQWHYSFSPTEWGCSVRFEKNDWRWTKYWTWIAIPNTSLHPYPTPWYAGAPFDWRHGRSCPTILPDFQAYSRTRNLATPAGNQRWWYFAVPKGVRTADVILVHVNDMFLEGSGIFNPYVTHSAQIPAVPVYPPFNSYAFWYWDVLTRNEWSTPVKPWDGWFPPP